MEDLLKRCWAAISLDHLAYNMKQIRSRLHAGCRVMAVVKANAYGHGDAALVPYFQQYGADWFAVSNLEEALMLRRNGAALPILILGTTPARYAAVLSREDITQTVFSADYADQLETEARRAGVTVAVHIKVDTGMSRIGFRPEEPEAIERVYRARGLRATGIFTHFACSDETDAESRAFTQRQYDRFTDVCRQLEEKGIAPGLRHCCNSGAVVQYPQMQLDMVRPGIILYGLAPSEELAGAMDLRPVMTLYSRVSMVKEIPADTPVSYGRTYTTGRPARVATVSCGYADGYPRALSSRASMRVGDAGSGSEAPVIGRVCMDQLILDVTGIPDVAADDTVVAAGGDGNQSFERLAALAGTIHYELVCKINRRVPRVYLEKGRTVRVVDYLE